MIPWIRTSLFVWMSLSCTSVNTQLPETANVDIKGIVETEEGKDNPPKIGESDQSKSVAYDSSPSRYLHSDDVQGLKYALNDRELKISSLERSLLEERTRSMQLLTKLREKELQCSDGTSDKNESLRKAVAIAKSETQFLHNRMTHVMKENAMKTKGISTCQGENARLKSFLSEQLHKIQGMQSEIEDSNLKVTKMNEAINIAKNYGKKCSYYYDELKMKSQAAMKSMWGKITDQASEIDDCRKKLSSYEMNHFTNLLTAEAQDGLTKSDAGTLFNMFSAFISEAKESNNGSANNFVKTSSNYAALKKELCAARSREKQFEECVPDHQYKQLLNYSNALRMTLTNMQGKVTKSKSDVSSLRKEILQLKNEAASLISDNHALEDRLTSAVVMSRLLQEDLQKMKDYRVKATNMILPFIPTTPASAENLSAPEYDCQSLLKNQLKFFENIEIDLMSVSEFQDMETSQKEALIKHHSDTLEETNERNVQAIISLPKATNSVSPTDILEPVHDVKNVVTVNDGTERSYSASNTIKVDALSASTHPSHDAIVVMNDPVAQASEAALSAVLGNSVIATLCAPLVTIIDNLKNEQDKATQQFDEYRSEMEKMKSERDAALAAVSDLQTSLSSVQRALAAQTSLVSSLRTQISNIESRYATAAAEWEKKKLSLETEVNQKDVELKLAKDEVNQLNHDISTLELDNSGLESSLKSCYTQLAEKNQKIAELTESNDKCDEDRTLLSQQNAQLQSSNVQLLQKMKDCEHQKSRIQDEFNMQFSDLRQCNVDLHDCSSTVTLCNENLAGCTVSNENYKNEATNAAALYSNLEYKYYTMEGSVEDLTKQFSALLVQAESCRADAESIAAAKEQLASILLEYRANVTVIDEKYNKLVLEELVLINNSLYTCDDDVSRLQVELVDCNNRTQSIITEMNGNCGQRENVIKEALVKLYGENDQMRKAIERALILSNAAEIAFKFLLNLEGLTENIMETTLERQNVTRHLLQVYEQENSTDVMPEVAVGHIILENAGVIFATPSSDYFYQHMHHQLQLYQVRILQMVCRCQHLGNCTMLSITEVFPESHIASDAIILSSMTPLSLQSNNGTWVLVDSNGYDSGRPSLDPTAYTFVKDVLPYLINYLSTADEIFLDQIRHMYVRCNCQPKTSGEFCEVIEK